MGTREKIKDHSRLLFNENGVTNITLRDVAKELGRSYGNITYHFPTKEHLIKELYEDMNIELSLLQTISPRVNLLVYFLELPNYSFDITLKYLFFYIDFVELRRNYPDFSHTVTLLNEKRRKLWMQLLQLLRKEGHLIPTLRDSDLEYIMFLSGSVRTFYWQMTENINLDKAQYCSAVNLLLKPYLSYQGLLEYDRLNPYPTNKQFY